MEKQKLLMEMIGISNKTIPIVKKEFKEFILYCIKQGAEAGKRKISISRIEHTFYPITEDGNNRQRYASMEAIEETFSFLKEEGFEFEDNGPNYSIIKW